MVEELDKDYVRTARGGGLPEFVVIARNVLRLSLIHILFRLPRRARARRMRRHDRS